MLVSKIIPHSTISGSWSCYVCMLCVLENQVSNNLNFHNIFLLLFLLPIDEVLDQNRVSVLLGYMNLNSLKIWYASRKIMKTLNMSWSKYSFIWLLCDMYSKAYLLELYKCRFIKLWKNIKRFFIHFRWRRKCLSLSSLKTISLFHGKIPNFPSYENKMSEM